MTFKVPTEERAELRVDCRLLGSFSLSGTELDYRLLRSCLIFDMELDCRLLRLVLILVKELDFLIQGLC
jgi:hypothetical protein